MNDLNIAVKIAVIDDEEFFYNAIKLKLKNYSLVKLTPFKGPQEFTRSFENNPQVIYDFIIIDRFFPGVDVIHDEIISRIRARGYKGIVILSSNSISLRENLKYPDCDYSFPKETTIRRLLGLVSGMEKTKDEE